jgi:hypothetical protein
MSEADKHSPLPPPSEPHSDFPLPGNWAQAWPIILWGILALALVFVFAESLGEIVVRPVYRAGSAAVALISVTAMIIYRRQLLEKFRDPSPSLIVAGISIVLLVLALSPFVEEKRWPFSAWFESDVATEAQKSTLIEWLQQAQGERDRTTAQRNVASARQSVLSTNRVAILDETDRMSANDKDRLANMFYELAQLFEAGEKLRQDCNDLNFAGHGAITDFVVSDLNGFTLSMNQISRETRDFVADTSRIKAKWAYYAPQLEYILGEDLDENNAMHAENALMLFKKYIDRWLSITNKDNPQVRELYIIGKMSLRTGWQNSASGLTEPAVVWKP